MAKKMKSETGEFNWAEIQDKTMFTMYQLDEIIPLVDIRLETILDDPDSATDFETEDNLNALRSKLTSGVNNFSSEEKKFLIEELECRIDVGRGNADNEGIKVYGMINALQNAIDKLTTL